MTQMPTEVTIWAVCPDHSPWRIQLDVVAVSTQSRMPAKGTATMVMSVGTAK